MEEGFRSDRRKLLRFILSDTHASLSDSDLDLLSADYIIDCLTSGRVVDVTEATTMYHNESVYPTMIHSQTGNSYFLVTDIHSIGSPPQRSPPPVDVNQTANNEQLSSGHVDSHIVETKPIYCRNDSDNGVSLSPVTQSNVENIEISTLGLPNLTTGLSEDNLRETAYEVLLVAIVFSGIEIYSVEHKRKEKTTKILSRVKNKPNSQSEFVERRSKIMDVIRVQMQISDSIDLCTRKRIMQFPSKKGCGQMDIPQISLNLLCGILKSDFLNEMSYMRWKRRQVKVLEEILYSSANLMKDGHYVIKKSLGKIIKTKEWGIIMLPSEHAELSNIAKIVSKFASFPKKFAITDETCYWTTCYHLNIRLYEKLLLGVFDILEENLLIEEADEFLAFVRLTWSTLGITQEMHNALYSWVFFQQFLLTGEATLLDHALLEMEKVLSSENNDTKESEYMNSLICTRTCSNSEIKLSLVQSVFFSMSIWCDGKLRDYHLHFSQNASSFEKVLKLAVNVDIFSSGECSEIKFLKSKDSSQIVFRKLQIYVESSLTMAYKRESFVNNFRLYNY